MYSTHNITSPVLFSAGSINFTSKQKLFTFVGRVGRRVPLPEAREVLTVALAVQQVRDREIMAGLVAALVVGLVLPVNEM